MIKRDRCQDIPRWCQGFKARWTEWDPASGLHQGQRSKAPRKKAGHMTAPRNDHQILKPTLAPTGPFSNRGDAVKAFSLSEHLRGHGSLRGQFAAAAFGPRRWFCKVHNGIAIGASQRLATQSPAPSPLLVIERNVLAVRLSGGLSGRVRRFVPAEWLARAPDGVEDYGELARQSDARFACPGSCRDRLRPVLQRTRATHPRLDDDRRFVEHRPRQAVATPRYPAAAVDLAGLVLPGRQAKMRTDRTGVPEPRWIFDGAHLGQTGDRTDAGYTHQQPTGRT